MAYNIIKGRVEFSNSATGSIESLVDIWRNQSVGGTKTFTSNITASGYWDSTRNLKIEPLSTLIGSDAANRVLTSDGDGTLTAESGLTFDGAQLIVGGHVTGSTFSGSAHGLTGIILNPDHLAAANYDGLANRLSASNIVLGNGLSSSVDPAGLGHGPELQVTGNQEAGIIVDSNGVRAVLQINGGLSFAGGVPGIKVSPANTSNKGGGPSDGDEFIIADSGDSDSTKNLTYSQIKTAITDSISVAVTTYNNSGDNRIITSVNSTTVNGEANLSFDGSNMEMSGGIIVSGTTAIKNNSVPAFRVRTGGGILQPDHVSINMGSEAHLRAPLAISNGGSALGAGIYMSRSGSSYLVDGDDIGHISFNTRGDTTRPGETATELTAISAKIQIEADGSEHNAESKPGRMSFWTCPTGTVDPVQRMTINNSGNVGIGAFNAPDHKLAVSGAISASLNISASAFYGDGSNLTGVNAGAGSIFTQLSNNLAATTSSVAIGASTAPNHAIAVSGAISASLNVSASSFIGDSSNLNVLVIGTGSAGDDGDGTNYDLDIKAPHTKNAAMALSAHQGRKNQLVTEVGAYRVGSIEAYNATLGGTANSPVQHLIVGSEVDARPGRFQIRMQDNSEGVESAVLTINSYDQASGNGALTASVPMQIMTNTFITATHVSSSLNISGAGFFGDGSGLTGVTGEWDGSHTGNATIDGTLSASNGLRSLDLLLDAGGTGRIGVTGDTDLMTLTADTVTVAGAVNSTTLSASSTVNLVGPTNFGRDNQTTISNIGIISSSAEHTLYKATLDRIIVGNATINDGLIDGTTIGNTVQSSGKFTQLSASGQTDIVGTTRFGYDNYTTISLQGVISSSATATLNNATLDRITVGNATLTNGQFSGSISGSGLLNSAHKLTADQIVAGTADINGGSINVSTVSASSTLQAMGVVTVGNGKTTVSAEGVLSSSATATFANATLDQITVGTVSAGNGSFSGHLTASAGLAVTGSSLVSGSVRTSYKLRESSGTYNVPEDTSVIIFNNGSAHTAVLPPLTDVNDGIQYYFKNIGSGGVTITGSALTDQFIDSQQTFGPLTQGESVKLMGYKLQGGFEWAVLSFRDL